MTDNQSSMEELAPAIDVDLATKLRDLGYRRKFFLAESSVLIAEQLVALRKRRELSQKEVAHLAGTQQPAISRAEQADYQNWSFNTLRSIADVLDARLRVLIEAAEDVLPQYETPEEVEDHLDGFSAEKTFGSEAAALKALFSGEFVEAGPPGALSAATPTPVAAAPKSMAAANDDAPRSVLAAM